MALTYLRSSIDMNPGRTPRTIHSAPTVCQTLFLDGATITSADLRAMSIRAGTDYLFVGSQGVTTTEFHPTIRIQFYGNNIMSFHDIRNNTITWLDDANGPRVIRGIAPSEPSSIPPQPMGAPRRPPGPPLPPASTPAQEGKFLCDCCAAAQIVKELEGLMAEHTRALLMDSDIAFHFPALVSPSNVPRFIVFT
jgi:hypothetical protein